MKVTTATGFTLDGRFQPLPPYVARILDMLVRADGETVSIEQLAGGRRPKSVHVFVTHLRKYLPPGYAIRCDFGYGYRLIRPHTDHRSTIVGAQQSCDRRIAGTK